MDEIRQNYYKIFTVKKRQRRAHTYLAQIKGELATNICTTFKANELKLLK